MKSSLIERLQEWDIDITKEMVDKLTWALAMDRDLHDEFNEHIRDERRDLRRELEANNV